MAKEFPIPQDCIRNKPQTGPNLNRVEYKQNRITDRTNVQNALFIAKIIYSPRNSYSLCPAIDMYEDRDAEIVMLLKGCVCSMYTQIEKN